MEIVLFATGSPILVDVEESLARASLRLRAGIRNRDGTDYLTAPTPLLRSTDLDPAILETPFLIPLFGSANRRLAAHEAKALGLDRPYSLIDPTAIVPRRLTFGPGSYVNAGCTLGAGSVFGAFVFVNRGTTIGHHAEIGDFVSIGPGVVVAGQVKIGPGTIIGAGATILPSIAIGANATIGAGSVVTHDVPPGTTVAGNPARARTGGATR
ncbi:MAG: acetyltransferase [Rhodospirillales bacterium]